MPVDVVLLSERRQGRVTVRGPTSSPPGGQCSCETVITMQHIHCRVDKPVDKPVITRVCGPQLLCIKHIAEKLGNQNVR